MIKMIASDLDGTLLREGAMELPKEVFRLIRELKEQGIFFVAASGRQYPSIRNLFAPVADDIGYICENGAVAIHQGEILYKDTLDPGLAREIIQEAWKKEGTELSISGMGTYYLRPKGEDFLDFVRKVLKFRYELLDDSLELPEPCVKVAIYERDGAMEALKFWQERFRDRCKVVTSGFEWIDFIPYGTDKRKGLEKFMEQRGITPDECVVFGDEYNDVEMLQAVKYSFAMESSKPGVKKVASYCVRQVEPILRQLLLNNGKMEEVLR